MINNRITQLLGIEYPIVQAPMGWITRAQLASAVSNAGGLGIIETSSGRLDEVRGEIATMTYALKKTAGGWETPAGVERAVLNSLQNRLRTASLCADQRIDGRRCPTLPPCAQRSPADC